MHIFTTVINMGNMEETKNLYLVKTRDFRAYVVATDTEKACEKFKKWLDDKNYGYYWARDFQSVEIIASTSETTPKTSNGVAFEDSRQDDMLFL